jgi:hypothetical protein
MYVSNNATFTGSQPLDIYGNLIVTGSPTISIDNINFAATITQNIDAQNATISNSVVSFTGAGGTRTLLSNWSNATSSNTQASLNIDAGTFNTGGYNVTCTGLSIGNATANLSSSTININQPYYDYGVYNFSASSSATLNAGTSTINIISSGPSAIGVNRTVFAGGNKTYYNVNFTVIADDNRKYVIILDSNTFNNLTFNGPVVPGQKNYTLTQNQTITGTFTVAGSNGNQRVNLVSSDLTTVQIVTAATVSLTDVTFCGITGSGTATWSGTRIGNAISPAGNSGITFTTPKTVYWNLVTGGYFLASTAWATSSGGALSTLNYPLPQDTAIIEDTGLNSSAVIRSDLDFASHGWNGSVAPTLDMSTRTIPMTLNVLDGFVSNGDITLSSAISVTSGGGPIGFCNPSTTPYSTFTTAGVTLNASVEGRSAAFQLVNDLITTQPLSLYGSNLLCNDNNITSRGLSLFSSNLACGNGTITQSGSSIGVYGNSSNITVTSGNPYITCTNTLSTYEALFSNVDIFLTSGTGTSSMSGYCRNLDFTGFSGAWLSNLETANGITIYGDLTMSPTMTVSTPGYSYVIIGFAGVSGTNYITTNGVTFNAPLVFAGSKTWILQDNLLVSSAKYITLNAGLLNANNNNVTCGNFISNGSTPRTVTMGSGTWEITGLGTSCWSSTGTNLTVNANTSTILLSNNTTSARTFTGTGQTFNSLVIGGNTSTSNTTINGGIFGQISSTKTVAHTVTVQNTVSTVAWGVFGSLGNVVTLTGGTLNKLNGGYVLANYMSINNSNATPLNTWYAINSTNGGGNTGWTFGAPSSSNNSFFLI